MKKMLLELKKEYEAKFTSYLKAAEILESIGDETLFKEVLKKASGCKLMIDGYNRKLENFMEKS